MRSREFRENGSEQVTDGVRLYYESAGTGRPVILINSMGTTRRTCDLIPQPDVGGGEQIDMGRVGGLERGEAKGLPFGLVRGEAAGGPEAQYPGGRVSPSGAEGGPGPVDQPGAVLLALNAGPG